MRNVVRILALLAMLGASSVVGAFVSSMVPAAHAAVTSSYNGDYEACNAAWDFHLRDTKDYLDRRVWEAAWHHAWHEAGYADPGLRRAIRHYLVDDSGRTWRVVYRDCGFAEN